MTDTTLAGLRAAIDHAGYHPELVADAMDAAVAGEPVEAFIVHQETTFDAEEVRRHITVLALTPGRLVLGGFSQGAMLSLDVALHRDVAPAGLVLMSGTLLAESVLLCGAGALLGVLLAGQAVLGGRGYSGALELVNDEGLNGGDVDHRAAVLAQIHHHRAPARARRHHPEQPAADEPQRLAVLDEVRVVADEGAGRGAQRGRAHDQRRGQPAG